MLRHDFCSFLLLPCHMERSANDSRRNRVEQELISIPEYCNVINFLSYPRNMKDRWRNYRTKGAGGQLRCILYLEPVVRDQLFWVSVHSLLFAMATLSSPPLRINFFLFLCTIGCISASCIPYSSAFNWHLTRSTSEKNNIEVSWKRIEYEQKKKRWPLKWKSFFAGFQGAHS